MYPPIQTVYAQGTLQLYFPYTAATLQFGLGANPSLGMTPTKKLFSAAFTDYIR